MENIGLIKVIKQNLPEIETTCPVLLLKKTPVLTTVFTFKFPISP